MCRPRAGEANQLFSVYIALWCPTALAIIYNVVGLQRNLGLIQLMDGRGWYKRSFLLPLDMSGCCVLGNWWCGLLLHRYCWCGNSSLGRCWWWRLSICCLSLLIASDHGASSARWTSAYIVNIVHIDHIHTFLKNVSRKFLGVHLHIYYMQHLSFHSTRN